MESHRTHRTQTMNYFKTIEEEITSLKDKWRNKSRKGKEYKKDKVRYWKLRLALVWRIKDGKTEVLIKQAQKKV